METTKLSLPKGGKKDRSAKPASTNTESPAAKPDPDPAPVEPRAKKGGDAREVTQATSSQGEQPAGTREGTTATAAVAGSPPARSPFARAVSKSRRIRAFLYGDTGSGKTMTALHFPKPAVIDLENGTDQYSDRYQFDRLSTVDADEFMATLDWLRENRHGYLTLVVDPITIYWEALQRKWTNIFLRRRRGKTGHFGEGYDLQTKDWQVIKAEWKEGMRKLLALDMNVVVTARQKAQYADGEFMKKVGETFDGEKSLPYLFDTVLYLARDGSTFHANVEKDRGLRIGKTALKTKSPGETYQIIEEAYGPDNVRREAKPIEHVSPAVAEKIETLIGKLGLPEDAVERRLQDYGASTVRDLSAADAEEILTKLDAAARAAAKNDKEGG